MKLWKKLSKLKKKKETELIKPYPYWKDLTLKVKPRQTTIFTIFTTNITKPSKNTFTTIGRSKFIFIEGTFASLIVIVFNYQNILNN